MKSLARRATAHATAAMLANPSYFAWWYTIKSIALVIAAALAAYFAGKSRGLAIATTSERWSRFA